MRVEVKIMTCLPWNDSLYGNYRTRTFQEIFPDVNIFLNGTSEQSVPYYQGYLNNGIQSTISTDSATTLYYLLYGRYGNSHIASSDENTFRYRVWSNIFMYGPTWEKRLEVQEKVRNLTEDELLYGSKAIHNHSYNPSTAPSTSTLEELTTINEQNTTQYKKNKMDAYTYLMGLLETDVTKYFLDTFQKLFLTVVVPEEPLWYVTDLNTSSEQEDTE